jgi:D-glycerate 3-kinase
MTEKIIHLIKNNYLKLKKKYLNFIKKQEVLGEPFYDKIGQLNKFYIPLCNSIYTDYTKINKTFVVGISGGQGSGKSTITKILKLILKTKYNLNTVIFSIDDFYKTLNEREIMSKKIHKLFLTRGVPGTHDIKLLSIIFKKLLSRNYKPFYMPAFDKAIDDRIDKKKWIKIKKKPEIIIFEGWCVGSKHQSKKELIKPINTLERKYDKDHTWRKKVNFELKTKYKKIYQLINKLIFLEVPSFKYVFKWRLLQEKKLKNSSKGKKIMSNLQVKNFIMYYERITRQMLKDLKKNADVIIRLDVKHKLNAIKFK